MTANDQRRAHWTQVRDAKAAVEILVHNAVTKANLQPISGPVTIRLIWYVPTRHHRDVDALAPTLKACMDSLVKKGILPDDHSGIVTEAHLGPIVLAPDNPRMELIIRTLEGPGPVSGDRSGAVVSGEWGELEGGEADLR